MKYITPEAVEQLVKELDEALEDFIFLETCKESGQPYGKYLDTLLEDSIVHLADKCEEYNDKFNNYIKNKKKSGLL